MTVSERIFQKLNSIGMSQKEFSEKTGIAQSTISEWKSKGNNPTAEKILPICYVLNITPEWLLSGTSVKGSRGNEMDYYVIDKNSEIGQLLVEITTMDQSRLDKLSGYISGLKK